MILNFIYGVITGELKVSETAQGLSHRNQFSTLHPATYFPA